MSNNAVTRSASAAWTKEQMSEAFQWLQQTNATGTNEELEDEELKSDGLEDDELEDDELEDEELEGVTREVKVRVDEKLETVVYDKAIGLARAVTDRVESAQPDTLEAKAGPSCFQMLGCLLKLRFDAVRDAENLHESIQCFSRAVEGLTDEDDEERTCIYRNLTTCLVLRYRITNDQKHLTEAMGIAQVLAHGKAADTIASVFSLHMVRELYSARFDNTKSLSHLEEAIEAAQPVLEHRRRSLFSVIDIVSHMGHLYLEKFRLTGDTKCLDHAVSLLQAVVDTFADISATRRRAQSEKNSLSLRNLALLLSERYQISGHTEDLRAAVGFLGKALAECPELHQIKLRDILWFGLADVYDTVFEREGHFESLVHECMLDTVRNLTNRPPYLFFLLGHEGQKRPKDESEADKQRRNAAIAWISGIADLFELSWRKMGSDGDIELALELTFNALQLAQGHPSRSELLTSQRARWRMWSDHVGKMPDCEVMVMATGDGDTLIPEELLGNLCMGTDAFVGPSKPCAAQSLDNQNNMPESAE